MQRAHGLRRFPQYCYEKARYFRDAPASDACEEARKCSPAAPEGHTVFQGPEQESTDFTVTEDDRPACLRHVQAEATKTGMPFPPAEHSAAALSPAP
ncbi:hypothetical protein [uncultured Desulfovibrio sp.]|uniref:hypothetical protein n=1 Tax=uncultured Desulfovibrio sp. TaxID=167968 RepID=UPI002633D66B|nr:hypothetical protein [uncultured Desulfovibrio sp.]